MNAKDEFAIDTRPFVLTGFYQMVDPNGSKLFGYNAHKLVHAVMLAFTSSCTFVGLSGVFYRPEDAAAATAVDSAKYDVQTLFYAACVAVGNLKMITAIRDAETVWRLFFVARGEEPSAAAVAFGGRPRNDGVQLASRGKRLANVFAWYSFLFASTVLAWVTMPIILNRGGSASGSGTQPDDENFRKTNVVNLRYPRAVTAPGGTLSEECFSETAKILIEVVISEYNILVVATRHCPAVCTRGVRVRRFEQCGNR